MYRYNTSLASTPTNSGGRRSGRAVRGSVKRRRSDGSSRSGGGGLKRKFEQIAQTSAKKWVRVYRAPASNITFKVPVWVPYVNLTEEERQDYDMKKERQATLRLQKQQVDNTAMPSPENDQGEGTDGVEEAGAGGVVPESFSSQDDHMEGFGPEDNAMGILEQEDKNLRINAATADDDHIDGEGEPAAKRAKVDDLPDYSLEAGLLNDDQHQETTSAGDYFW